MSSLPPAKFFVNQGVVTSRTDMLHLLRPLLKQTVTYRYQRGREVVAHQSLGLLESECQLLPDGVDRRGGGTSGDMPAQLGEVSL